MIIDITSIPEGRSSLERKVTYSGSEERPWPLWQGNPTVKVDIDRMGEEYHLAVSFTGIVLLECARCLEVFGWPVSTHFRTIARKSGESEPPSEEDYADVYFTDENPKIDLEPILFDEVAVSLPMKPLCTASCSGIQRPNQVENNDAPGDPQIDPRWDALRKLKEGK